jgi:hypothetical protein
MGKRAYKFPSLRNWRDFLFGLLNNMNEKEWSRKTPLACPVLWGLPGGFLIAMPRCRILTDDEFAAIDYTGFKAASQLKPEPKADSFGYLNGAVVAVDYGW